MPKANSKPVRPELRRLANFIYDKATSRGLRLYNFCQKYGLTNSTLHNYVKARQVPELSVLLSIAEALRKETGEPIGLRTLLDLIDDLDGVLDGKAVERNSRPKVEAKEVFNQFQSLPFQERISLVSSLLGQISKDVKLATSDKAEVVAVLLEEELRRRGCGLARFAEEAELPESLLSDIAKRRLPEVVPSQTLELLAASIKDLEGQYGNVSFFAGLIPASSSSPLQVRLEAVLRSRSVEALVDELLESEDLAVTPRQRRGALASIEALRETGTLSQNDPSFELIGPPLARVLGLASPGDLIAANLPPNRAGQSQDEAQPCELPPGRPD